jgi:hypothetical protein
MWWWCVEEEEAAQSLDTRIAKFETETEKKAVAYMNGNNKCTKT